MLFFFLLSQLFSIPSQEWIPYYEDKNIAISYTPKLCEDKQNGFAFEYYFIKVENRTDQTLVVNFNKSAEAVSKEEDNVAFVLAPHEIKKGSCEFSPVKLRVYKTDRRSSKSTRIDPFALSKIKVIEIK